MSVILDALQKARSDRRKDQVEPHPNSVARVLEPTVSTSQPNAPSGQSHTSASLSWLLPVSVIVGILLLLALAGGAFFLLYNQMLKLDPAATVKSSPIVPPTVQAAGAIETPSLQAELAAPSGAALPPPAPLSDLPVQPPSSAAAANSNSTYAASPAGNVAPSTVDASAVSAVAAPTAAPELKLGSIVCENNVCMALINGRTVREGERIRNYTVAKITDNGVTLKSVNGSDEIHLDLYN